MILFLVFCGEFDTWLSLFQIFVSMWEKNSRRRSKVVQASGRVHTQTWLQATSLHEKGKAADTTKVGVALSEGMIWCLGHGIAEYTKKVEFVQDLSTAWWGGHLKSVMVSPHRTRKHMWSSVRWCHNISYLMGSEARVHDEQWVCPGFNHIGYFQPVHTEREEVLGCYVLRCWKVRGFSKFISYLLVYIRLFLNILLSFINFFN